MVYVVVNPLNSSELNLFSEIGLAQNFLVSQGYALIAHRDLKVSPRARLFYARTDGESRYVYCKNVDE